MEYNGGNSKDLGRRRVRMTRETGQSLVLSSLCGGCQEGERLLAEIRISQVCAGGVAIVDVVLPDNVFVERKETLDGLRALFPHCADN